MLAVVSQDGGVTLGSPILISELRASDVRPLRGSAADRRRRRSGGPRPRGLAGLPLPERVRRERRRPLAVGGRPVVGACSRDRGRNVAIPTIGIEPVTGRLAIAYYVIRPAASMPSSSPRRTPAGTAPQRLTPRTMPLLDARHDARAHARGLHRRLVVARPPARRLCARLPAEQPQAAAGDLRSAQLTGVTRARRG